MKSVGSPRAMEAGAVHLWHNCAMALSQYPHLLVLVALVGECWHLASQLAHDCLEAVLEGAVVVRQRFAALVVAGVPLGAAIAAAELC